MSDEWRQTYLTVVYFYFFILMTKKNQRKVKFSICKLIYILSLMEIERWNGIIDVKFIYRHRHKYIAWPTQTIWILWSGWIKTKLFIVPIICRKQVWILDGCIEKAFKISESITVSSRRDTVWRCRGTDGHYPVFSESSSIPPLNSGHWDSQWWSGVAMDLATWVQCIWRLYLHCWMGSVRNM